MEALQHSVLPVAGMDCADCALKLERSVGQLPGVASCTVSFAAAQVTLAYDPGVLRLEQVVQRVRALGYNVPRAAEREQQHRSPWTALQGRPHTPPCEKCDDLLDLAAAVERRYEHPIAAAVVQAAAHRRLERPYAGAAAVESLAGRGVRRAALRKAGVRRIAVLSGDNEAAAQAIGRHSARRILSQHIFLSLAIKALFLVLALLGGATLWMAVFAEMGVSLLVTLNDTRLLVAQPDSLRA